MKMIRQFSKWWLIFLKLLWKSLNNKVVFFIVCIILRLFYFLNVSAISSRLGDVFSQSTAKPHLKNIKSHTPWILQLRLNREPHIVFLKVNNIKSYFIISPNFAVCRPNLTYIVGTLVYTGIFGLYVTIWNGLLWTFYWYHILLGMYAANVHKNSHLKCN